MHSNAQAPYTGTTASAGHDLHNVEEIWLDPNTTKIASTGLGIQIPKGYYGRIAPRSSLAQKGVQIMAGIIDSDYVGEIKVLLHNVSKETLHFLPDTRIAQIFIVPHASTDYWEKLDTPPKATTRYSGFGSTDYVAGTNIWARRHSTDPPRAGEVIAQGGNNVVVIMFSRQEEPEMYPTNQLFLGN
ncbi:deoxyuridine 5'-triphosphate nucleotidohydrolase-like [Hipposideros larvatus]